jgi:hypothetical protein
MSDLAPDVQASMLIDKQLVIITDKVVLVPYLPRHVDRYHRTFAGTPATALT